MRRKHNGVLVFSTPFLLTIIGWLGCLLPASLWAASAVVPNVPLMSGNSMTANTPQRIVLTADHLSYHEAEDSLQARGHVRMWYGDMTLTADEAEANLNNRVMRATGNVILTETGRSLNCAQLDYDINSRQALAQGILFSSPPWFYQGESIEKVGEKQVNINQALFTTCNARHPHYHLTAQTIEVVLGESLTAYNAVLFVGTTPVFYLPWIQRSLKDHRPPFSFRVGYNDFEGGFAKIRYNYFFSEAVYGALILDMMQKKGVGTGLEQHYRYQALGIGDGQFSVYYIKDTGTNRERWTANYSHRQDLSSQDVVQINADYISDRSFNREFSYSLVDSFQQKSFLSYAHRSAWDYFGISASDTESWNPLEEKYLPSERSLPSINYSYYSKKLITLGAPIYFSGSASFNRNLNPYRNFHYWDDLTLNPSLTQSYAFPKYVPTMPSLSGSVSLPLGLHYREISNFDDFVGQTIKQPAWDAAYTTNVTLTNNWVYYRRTKPTHQVQSRLSHDFTRSLPVQQGVIPLGINGINGHRMRLALDYFMGSVFTLQGSTSYSLLPVADAVSWRDVMDPLSFNGQAQLPANIILNWQGVHDWKQERITSGYCAQSISGKRWNLALNESFSYTNNSNQPYILFGTLNGSYRFMSGYAMSSNLQYNLMTNQFTNLSVGLTADLHCWELQSAFKLYLDGKTEIGLGLTLKAFPGLSIGMGGPQGIAVGQ